MSETPIPRFENVLDNKNNELSLVLKGVATTNIAEKWNRKAMKVDLDAKSHALLTSVAEEVCGTLPDDANFAMPPSSIFFKFPPKFNYGRDTDVALENVRGRTVAITVLIGRYYVADPEPPYKSGLYYSVQNVKELK